MTRARMPEEDKDHGVQIGQIIKRNRGTKGLSRRGLAHRSKVSPDEVERLEGGKIFAPGFLVVAKLAEALGLGLDELHRRASGREGGQPS